METILIQRFLIALALGLLIGLEREYARYKERGHEYAGIRTFPLITLFGALAAFLGEFISIWILLLGMLLVGILIIVAYFGVKDKKHIGATTEIAGLLAFFIGILTYYGEISFAVILTIAIAVILYARSMLHHFAERISKKELGSTLAFVVIAFIVLPFLPDQGYGPYNLFNPYLIWLMVVLISGIGFIGYALMKWYGEKGIVLAGLLGGIVSSTATTISFAQRSMKEVKVYPTLVLGVLLANAVMFIRVLIEIFVINRSLLSKMLLPLLGLAVLTFVFSYFLWKKSKKIKGKIELGTPLALKPAIQFAVIFAFILALIKLANIYLSSKGVYVVSFLSGFADVDAVTLSLSELAKTELAENIARDGILIAVLTNVAVKGGIAYWLGSKEFGKAVLGYFAVL
ncbi:MAG: MgtC/SapB family protein, partial [Nanoarchaeota archaeon]|nr:MgtC/SapB family protein [Nanoarchaeota archaeon]